MAKIYFGLRAAKMPTPDKLKKIIGIVKDACIGLIPLVNAPGVPLSAKVAGVLSLILGALLVFSRLVEKYTGTAPIQNPAT